MVKAFRDTWELGIHSYLTYLRDRLLLARDLLHESGSVFVQISDENVHHVREYVMRCLAPRTCEFDYFQENYWGWKSGRWDESACEHQRLFDLVCADIGQIKYRELFVARAGEGWVNYNYVKLADGTHRRMSAEEAEDWSELPPAQRSIEETI